MHRIGAKKKMLPVCNNEGIGRKLVGIADHDLDAMTQRFQQIGQARRLRAHIVSVFDEDAYMNVPLEGGLLQCFAASATAQSCKVSE